MAVKKSELYSTLWESCNNLRSKGSMDATQYKDYVLIILFIKVITDKYYNKKDALLFVPDDANFNTLISLVGKSNIGEEINKVIRKIAEQNNLSGVIDIIDFNDETKLGTGKDKVDALSGLINVFQNEELNFKNNRADDDDILGDAYEYLMKQFASESGKSKGQFYTPAEASRIMAKLIGINNAKTDKPILVYDMACGSGSLLLRACAEAPASASVFAYGQEKDGNTAGLAIMNMYLHGNETADIKVGNTLTDPKFAERFASEEQNGSLKQFDYCVANPPFSVKKWSNGSEKYGRYDGYGMPPEGCADFAFLLHMLKSMNSDHGRGAIILPHGVLFRGGQEEIIRKNLVIRGNIEGIIALPSNLFYGTGIPACIIILDKKYSHDRKSIFMIDASKGFVKDGNKNRLREEDVRKITDTYIQRLEIDGYSKNVLISDIEQNDYNLNILKYINSNMDDNNEDIKAHLLGGIPKVNIDSLNKYWAVAPKLKEELFKNDEKEGYLKLNVDKKYLFDLISESKELSDYSKSFLEKIHHWEDGVYKTLSEIDSNTLIKSIIDCISNDLLDIFEGDQLIDKYDAYEKLMNYCSETMKDDFHIIVENGWIPTITYAKDKKGNIKKTEFESELLPKQVVINNYFSDQFSNIEKVEEKLNELISVFDSIVEENTGDELLFPDDIKVSEKVLKEMKAEETEDNIIIINGLLDNLKEQKNIKKEIKELQSFLNEKIINKYNELDEKTSIDLIINKKWFINIEEKLNNMYQDIIFTFANKIMYQIENYEETLSQLLDKSSEYEKLVLDDLKGMGFEC